MRGIYQTKDVVGLLLKPHKRFRGLTQNEIADALRITRQAVSRHASNVRSEEGRNGQRPVRKRLPRKVRKDA